MKEYFMILNGLHIHTVSVPIQVKPKWKKLVGMENWILQLKSVKNYGKHDDK